MLPREVVDALDPEDGDVAGAETRASLLRGARRRGDSTWREYARQIGPWKLWCCPPSRGERPARWLTPFPADRTGDSLAEYVDTLAQQGLAPATITKIKSAIMAWHDLLGHPVPDGRPATARLSSYKLALKAAGWEPGRAEPATLEQVIGWLGNVDRSRPLGVRDTAAVLLAFAGALPPARLVAIRVGEVAWRGSRPDRHLVVVPEADEPPVTVPHWYVEGRHLDALCPADAVMAWDRIVRAAGAPAGSPWLRATDVHGHIAGTGEAWAGNVQPGGGALSVGGLGYVSQRLLAGAPTPTGGLWESLRAGGLVRRRADGLGLDDLADVAGLARMSPMLLRYVRAAEGGR